DPATWCSGTPRVRPRSSSPVDSSEVLILTAAAPTLIVRLPSVVTKRGMRAGRDVGNRRVRGDDLRRAAESRQAIGGAGSCLTASRDLAIIAIPRADLSAHKRA